MPNIADLKRKLDKLERLRRLSAREGVVVVLDSLEARQKYAFGERPVIFVSLDDMRL